jgi:flagellin-like protein
MNVRNLFTDDDAVSPVIGVILMVAITVILAAVIGAFVLNIGGSQDTTPSLSFDFEQTDADNIEVTVQSASETVDNKNWGINGSYADGDRDSDELTTDSNTPDLNSGETFTVAGTGSFTITWKSPDSDTTAVLGEYSG